LEVTGITKRQKNSSSKSEEKKMLVCLYDSKGIIHHQFVPEGHTLSESFHLSVLDRLWKRIRRVQPEYSAPGIWFLLHDNAPGYLAVAVQEFLARKQVCILHHPPYSPELYPCY
jgi:histone-lysine N-methyltransferase SETMAR